MDAVSGFFLWPLVTLGAYVRFFVGVLLCFYPLVTVGTGDFFRLFERLAVLPFGKRVFSGLIGIFAPYSASVSPCVQRLDQDGCHVSITAWPWLRNPYSCLHAIALANLGEQTGGILMLALLQRAKSVRAIPVRVDTLYFAKARGVILGKSNLSVDSLLQVSEKGELAVVTKMFDEKNVLVAETTATWMVEKKKKSE